VRASQLLEAHGHLSREAARRRWGMGASPQFFARRTQEPMSSRLDRIGTWFDQGSRLPPCPRFFRNFTRPPVDVVAGSTGRAMCISRQGRFRQHRLSLYPRPPLFARRLPDPHKYCCLPVAMAESICWPSMPRFKPMVTAPAGQMTAFFLVTYVQYLFFSKLCQSPPLGLPSLVTGRGHTVPSRPLLPPSALGSQRKMSQSKNSFGQSTWPMPIGAAHQAAKFHTRRQGTWRPLPLG
jgi:hypothetical protein